MGDYKFSALIYNPFKFDLKQKIDLKTAILVVVISNPEKKTIL
jgi:hypothetical protein